jgi:hypothetical protein
MERVDHYESRFTGGNLLPVKLNQKRLVLVTMILKSNMILKNKGLDRKNLIEPITLINDRYSKRRR